MPDGSNVTIDDIASLQKDLGKVSDEVKNFAEDSLKKLTAGQEVTTELKDAIDKTLVEQGGLRARIEEMEQKLARPPGPNAQAQGDLTPGQVFLENERVKAAMADAAHFRGRVRVDMAAITTMGIGARNVLVPEQRQAGILTIPERRMTVRDLLTPGRTSSNAIQYVKETGFTNAAAIVTEGQAKPESTLTVELLTKSVSTIAHWILASKQILDDAPMLESHIDGRLRYGLAYVEEQQLLNGSGSGEQLHGIIPQATPFAAPFTPVAEQSADRIRLSILQSELAEFPATGIVMHPTDWTRIELLKDTQGRYLFANPQGLATPTLWARPVVATQAMTIDKFLVGAFRLGAQVFDREDANVEISTEDSDNFRKNLVTIRGEERLVLAVYRPEAFVYGDFGLVT